MGTSFGTCLCAVDPLNRAIAVHAFEGLLRIIPITEEGTFDEMFTVSLDRGHLIDFCFLYTNVFPTLCLLHDD